MAEMFNMWSLWILKHVPMVTWIGLTMAAALWLIYMGKRYRECALLAAVCVAYGISPYLPHF